MENDGGSIPSSSRRRWMLLRSVLLKKEVDLREYADITTRSLDDIRLLKKERTEEGEDYVIVRYDVLGMAQLTLKQSEEKKLRVKSLSELRTGTNDADRTGIVTLWPSEEALAFLCAKRAGDFEGKVVIEVGSGLGLAGLAIAATTKAKAVLLTDGNSDAVDRLRENIALNQKRFGQTQVLAQKLDWSDAASLNLLAGADASETIVICSDCVYDERLYEPLAKCLGANASAESWLMCPDRHGGHARFLRVARECGLEAKVGWTVPQELAHLSRTKLFPHLLVLN